MIQPYQCIPSSITRRNFGRVIMGGAAAASGLLPTRAYAADDPFTVAIVPDPQYLAGDGTCSGSTAYDALINWAITNKNLSVGGAPLNVKGFVQVGDCINNATGTNIAGQYAIATAAYAQAAAANMFVAYCAGNHDYAHIFITGRSTINDVFVTGAWSPSNVASIYGTGMNLPGGGVAIWGGAYANPNFPLGTHSSYIRLLLGSRRILLISMSIFPSSAELNWGKGLHDLYPDHEVWITTHGYLRTDGTQMTRNYTYGPASYYQSSLDFGAAPASNAGDEMWAGSDATWAGFTAWPRVKAIFSGHDINGYSSGWVWQRTPATNNYGGTVQQIFCNCQENDNTNFCSGNPATPNGTSDTAHLFLLRVWPTTVEAFLVSTNANKWLGGSGVTGQASPVQLFSVGFAPSPVAQVAIDGSARFSGGIK